MNSVFQMNSCLFGSWVTMLIDEQYNWDEDGISLKHCNNISIPKCGIELLDWSKKSFRIIDERKYVSFLLRYR